VIPADTGAEASLLGACLADPSVVHEVRALVAPADLTIPEHRAVYDAILRRVDAGLPVDPVLLEAPPETVARLLAGNYLSIRAAAYAKQVHDRSTLRRALAACASIEDAANSGKPPEEVVAEARRLFLELEGGGQGGPVRLGDKLADTFDAIGKKGAEPTKHFVRTGIDSFDRVIGGFRKGQLIVVAARPGVGKTSLARTITLQSCKGGAPTLFFSLEMTVQEMTEAFISAHSRFSAHRLGTGDITHEDYTRLYSECSTLAGYPLWLDDRMLSMSQLAATARAWRARNPSDQALVVVDYLGLIRADEASENRALEVGRMAWACKVLAKDLGCPVILCAQLNREVSKRGGGDGTAKPVLSDLRDSGEIEQTANQVLFLHRPDILQGTGRAQLIVAKNRGGPTGEFDLWFNAETMTFHDIAEEQV